MSASEASLTFKIKSDSSQARSDLSGFSGLVRKEVGDIGQQFAGGAGRIGTFAASLGPVGLALGATAGALIATGGAAFALTSRAVELGSTFNDLSLATGLAVETISGLSPQLKESGTDANALGSAVLILHKNLGQAAEGNKELRKTFAELGIKDVDAALVDTEGSLRAVLLALGKLTNEGDRDRLGTEALGRAYKELRVFIADTGGDIEETLRKARAAGLIMSTEVASNLDALGDRWDALGTKTRVFSANFVGIVAPEIVKGLDDISGALGVSSERWESWALGAAISVGRIRGALKGLAEGVATGNPWKMGEMVEAGAEAGGWSAINTYASARGEAAFKRLFNARGSGGDTERTRGGGGRKGGGTDKAAQGRLKDIQADQTELDADFRREGEALERDYRRRLDTLAQFTEQELSLLDTWITAKRAIFDREEAEVNGSTKNEAERERKLRDIQTKRTAAEDEYARRRNAATDKREEQERQATEANEDKKLKIEEAKARARISAIEQVADLGIKRESQAAEEIGAIQLDLHGKQMGRLQQRLEQQEQGSAEYRRIQGELGAAEIEHAALVEEVAHRVVMAKKREVEAERERLEALRRMRAQARSEGLELERGFVLQAASEDDYRTRSERIATIRQLADIDRRLENAQHEARVADIEQLRTDNLKKAQTEQERLEALKLYHAQIENEMRAHQLRLGEIGKGEDDDVKAESPFKAFEDLWSSFKSNATNAEDSIGNSVAALSETVVVGFRNMEGALKQGVAAHYLYGASLGEALKKALAAQLANLAAEFHVQGIRHAAYALGSLAFGDFRGAALHGAASAAFFAAGALTGKVASGLAKSAGMYGEGGASGGAAVAATSRANGRDANQSDDRTIREARRGESDPNVLEQSRNSYSPVPIIIHQEPLRVVVETHTKNDPGTFSEQVVKTLGSNRFDVTNAIARHVVADYRQNGSVRNIIRKETGDGYDVI